MQFFDHFRPLQERYDAFILDLWGVVHDGSALYPGVRETLIELKDHGKKVVFLSNAPRRMHKVTAVLDALGVSKDLYLAAFSSGEAGARALEADTHKLGNHYFYIGPSKDEDILEAVSGQTAADELEQADYLLNVGFGSEEESTADWGKCLAQAQARGLRMLCLNPDLEVVKITGERFACAGVIAKEYESIGGEVIYYGKPHPAVYTEVMKILETKQEDILAVGDSLHTDILGANHAGIASALATGGILKRELEGKGEQEVRDFIARQDAVPDYVLSGIGH